MKSFKRYIGLFKWLILLFFFAKHAVCKRQNDVCNIWIQVHGGTTNADIMRRVQKAEALAIKNQETYGKNMYTVLFLDEANSTEAIGLIKEILCDRAIQGIPIKHCESLKIVAACNPYRK